MGSPIESSLQSVIMAPAANKKSLLERLAAGPVIGDGGFVFELEKRGYVKAGPWTPEAAVENPEAVRQLHREFLRAGADVMQAFTFYASNTGKISSQLAVGLIVQPCLAVIGGGLPRGMKRSSRRLRAPQRRRWTSW